MCPAEGTCFQSGAIQRNGHPQKDQGRQTDKGLLDFISGKVPVTFLEERREQKSEECRLRSGRGESGAATCMGVLRKPVGEESNRDGMEGDSDSRALAVQVLDLSILKIQ